MTPDLRFDFLTDRTAKTMTIRREFAGPRRLVWDCHTRSDLLDCWFAPEPLTTVTKSMDFRAGGHWHYGMVTPDGPTYWSRLDYLTVDPIDGYTALDAFSDAEGGLAPDLPRSRWEVTFADKGARTLVQTLVSYDSTENLDKVVAMGMEQGMTSTLGRLDKLLATLEAEENPI